MSNTSFDFDYRGRPAALRSGTYFRDRANAINAEIAAERARAQGFKNTVATLAFIGIAALSGLAGFTLAQGERAADLRTFDLIQFTGEESDIIDYDLSREDCQRALLERRGLRLACELSR